MCLLKFSEVSQYIAAKDNSDEYSPYFLGDLWHSPWISSLYSPASPLESQLSEHYRHFFLQCPLFSRRLLLSNLLLFSILRNSSEPSNESLQCWILPSGLENWRTLWMLLRALQISLTDFTGSRFDMERYYKPSAFGAPVHRSRKYLASELARRAHVPVKARYYYQRRLRWHQSQCQLCDASPS